MSSALESSEFVETQSVSDRDRHLLYEEGPNNQRFRHVRSRPLGRVSSTRRPAHSAFPIDPEILLLQRALSVYAVINVGGERHVVPWRTLDRFPRSRLGRLSLCGKHEDILELCDDYTYKDDEETIEFFFDRYPKSFASIINFYRTGKLHLIDEVRHELGLL